GATTAGAGSCVRRSSSRSRSGTAKRMGRSVGRLGRSAMSTLLTALAVTVTDPCPPTSRDLRVHGSGSVLSASATALMNHSPGGMSASRYEAGLADLVSTIIQDNGLR